GAGRTAGRSVGGGRLAGRGTAPLRGRGHGADGGDRQEHRGRAPGVPSGVAGVVAAERGHTRPVGGRPWDAPAGTGAGLRGEWAGGLGGTVWADVGVRLRRGAALLPARPPRVRWHSLAALWGDRGGRRGTGGRRGRPGPDWPG